MKKDSQKNSRIETERLILRQLEMKDISDVVRNVNNIKVSKWLLVVPYPYKKKDAIFWIKSSAKKAKAKPRKDYSFGIELKESKEVIGGIGISSIKPDQGTASIGYWLGEDHWRYGYGSEALEKLLDFAFRDLKIRRLEAGVFAGNSSSGKLLEKYGFKREGYKRKAKKCKADGKIKDEIMYGLLRKEYRGRK